MITCMPLGAMVFQFNVSNNTSLIFSSSFSSSPSSLVVVSSPLPPSALLSFSSHILISSPTFSSPILFYHSLLPFSSQGRLLQRSLTIPRLGSHGSHQLAADLEYLGNVLGTSLTYFEY